MVALCQMQLAPVSLPHTHMRTAPRVKGPQKLGTRGELLRRSETICSQRARKVSATSPAEADRAARVLLVALCTYLELVLVWSIGAMLLRGPRTRDRAAVGESERRVRRSERERESRSLMEAARLKAVSAKLARALLLLLLVLCAAVCWPRAAQPQKEDAHRRAPPLSRSSNSDYIWTGAMPSWAEKSH